MKKADEARQLSGRLQGSHLDRCDVLGPRSFRPATLVVRHSLSFLERLVVRAFDIRRVEEHVLAGSGVDKPETLVRLSLDRTLWHFNPTSKKSVRRYPRYGLIRRMQTLYQLACLRTMRIQIDSEPGCTTHFVIVFKPKAHGGPTGGHHSVGRSADPSVPPAAVYYKVRAAPLGPAEGPAANDLRQVLSFFAPRAVSPSRWVPCFRRSADVSMPEPRLCRHAYPPLGWPRGVKACHPAAQSASCTLRTLVGMWCLFQRFHPRKAGVPCSGTISTNSHFFRDDEQAAEGLSVRNSGQAGSPYRPRRQAVGGKAGSK